MLAPIDWTRDPGDPLPTDNRTPQFAVSRLPAELLPELKNSDFIIFQCTHNSVGSRRILEGIETRTPAIAKVISTAAEALQSIFWTRWRDDISAAMSGEPADENGNPLMAKLLLHHIQSVRTILYWADRNRRDAAARERAVTLTAHSRGVTAAIFRHATQEEKLQALAKSRDITTPERPERLHRQAQAALDIARQGLAVRFETQAIRPQDEYNAAEHAGIAVAYLMAHSLGAKWPEPAHDANEN